MSCLVLWWQFPNTLFYVIKIYKVIIICYKIILHYPMFNLISYVKFTDDADFFFKFLSKLRLKPRVIVLEVDKTEEKVTFQLNISFTEHKNMCVHPLSLIQ